MKSSKIIFTIVYSIFFVVVTLLIGCSTDIDNEDLLDGNKPAAKHIVKVVARTPDNDNADTRVSFSAKNGGGYSVLWDEDEKFLIGEFIDDGLNQETGSSDFVKTADDGSSAAFSFEMSMFSYDYDELDYYVAYPYDNVSGFFDYNDEKTVIYTLPYNQKQSISGLVDNSGVLMFGESKGHSEQPETLDIHFRHIASYGRMTLTALKAEKGEIVQSVSFETEEILAAGLVEYYWEKGTLTAIDKHSKSITVNVSSLGYAANEDIEVWFSTLPTKELSEFTVRVETDKKVYTREVQIPTNRTGLKFEVGVVSAFIVDMLTASTTEK